ncbi:MAG: S1 family peptidase [Anaerolineae bacterium]
MEMTPETSITAWLARSTVRIESELSDGGTGIGTGFFYAYLIPNGEYVPLLVTNKHVVRDATRMAFQLSLADHQGNVVPGYRRVVVDTPGPAWTNHPSPDVDLCAMPAAFLFDLAEEQGERFHFRVLVKEQFIPSADELGQLQVMEDIVMVGYPIGLWDQKHNMPVFRKGVTATHPALDWNGRPVFLIDASCFPGSSGSPVVLYNPTGYLDNHGVHLGGRVKLLGVLCEAFCQKATGEIEIVEIPTRQRPIVTTEVTVNLGVVIRSQEIARFEPIFQDRLELQPY